MKLELLRKAYNRFAMEIEDAQKNGTLNGVKYYTLSVDGYGGGSTHLCATLYYDENEKHIYTSYKDDELENNDIILRESVKLKDVYFAKPCSVTLETNNAEQCYDVKLVSDIDDEAHVLYKVPFSPLEQAMHEAINLYQSAIKGLNDGTLTLS